MKMALFLVASFCAVLAVGSQAEAKKAPKYKVVAVTFSETDTHAKRGPASIDEKNEMDAAARFEQRARYASNQVIPDLE